MLISKNGEKNISKILRKSFCGKIPGIFEYFSGKLKYIFFRS